MGRIRYSVVQENGQEVVKEIHKVVVHQFSMSDVEDPDLYAAEPLYQWQQTEAGKFVMNNAVDTPIWHRHNDFASYSYVYAVTAELEKKKLSEFYLRFGKPIK